MNSAAVVPKAIELALCSKVVSRESGIVTYWFWCEAGRLGEVVEAFGHGISITRGC